MKAISLWQPWASLWCSCRKIHETRHWPIRHRGWLLVHAAKKIVFDEASLDAIVDDEFGPHWGLELPRGAIIGKVEIIACVPTEQVYTGPPLMSLEEAEDYECGDFAAGRFAWKRGAFELFPRPIPYRGSQGFFDVADAVLNPQETPNG